MLVASIEGLNQMKEVWGAYWKRFWMDLFLFLLAVVPVIASFILEVRSITFDLFSRCGAIMVMFGAFLEFRVHEVNLMRSRDHFHALWGSVATLTEGLANVDKLSKWSARQLSTLIASAGMEPNVGRADEIKDMVVSDKIKALKKLPRVPDSFYKYSRIVSLAGKLFVVLGTVIWAFGDIAVQYVN
jgi:hypothetical protein